MKNIIGIIVVIVVIWGIYTLLKGDEYIGFYYPDKNNLTNDIQSNDIFDSLESCRDWIDEQKSIYNPAKEILDDYECAKNCDLSGGKPYICEETLQ